MTNRKLLSILQIIVISFVLIGCNDVKEEVKNNEILLNKGAFVDDSNSNEVYNLNTENNYEEIETEGKIITNYNVESNTYVFYKDGNYYISYNLNDIKIDHAKIANIKISPKGEYVFYFINDEYLVPAVMDLKNKKEILLDNKAIISGQFIDWITEEKLAFYGVNTENKTNGIFTYDIKNGKEENLYNIKNGYVKFLKHIDDGLALVEEHYGEETILNVINVDGTVREISKEVLEITDIESVNGKLYLLGTVKDNNFSIYEIDNTTIKRLLFDFPNVLYADKGLSVNDLGEVLFVGSNGNSKEEHLYKYVNGSISLMCDVIKSCNFIKIN